MNYMKHSQKHEFPKFNRNPSVLTSLQSKRYHNNPKYYQQRQSPQRYIDLTFDRRQKSSSQSLLQSTIDLPLASERLTTQFSVGRLKDHFDSPKKSVQLPSDKEIGPTKEMSTFIGRLKFQPNKEVKSENQVLRDRIVQLEGENIKLQQCFMKMSEKFVNLSEQYVHINLMLQQKQTEVDQQAQRQVLIRQDSKINLTDFLKKISLKPHKKEELLSKKQQNKLKQVLTYVQSLKSELQCIKKFTSQQSALFQKIIKYVPNNEIQNLLVEEQQNFSIEQSMLVQQIHVVNIEKLELFNEVYVLGDRLALALEGKILLIDLLKNIMSSLGGQVKQAISELIFTHPQREMIIKLLEI